MIDINNLIMQGVVTEIIGSRARVVFADREDMVSAPLQVLQLYTGQNKSIQMPSIDEEVVCIFLPTGLEDGYIIGSVYTDGNNPPADNNAVLFSDGSSLNFNNGVLNINMLQSINITAPQSVFNGDVSVNGNLSTSGTSTTQGNISTSGSINASGDVVGGGKSLINHTNGGQGVD